MPVKKMAVVFLFLIGCSIYHKTPKHLPSVNNNVCKKLQGCAVLYAVFVDTKYTQPWSEHDIRTTLDSIRKAATWLENLATHHGTAVTIKVDYHENNKKIPIKCDFQKKTLSGTLFYAWPSLPPGIKLVDKWANKVSKTAGRIFPADTSRIIKTKNRATDRERLIAKLRNHHKTDNIALMFFINNYFTDEISVTFHLANTTEIEYAVVSYKEPGVIAHEFLHLFGALDLYVSPWDNRKTARKKLELARKYFPNDIMAFPERKLDSLDVSPFTKYLIGWDNEMDPQYKKLLLGKKIQVVKY